MQRTDVFAPCFSCGVKQDRQAFNVNNVSIRLQKGLRSFHRPFSRFHGFRPAGAQGTFQPHGVGPATNTAPGSGHSSSRTYVA